MNIDFEEIIFKNFLSFGNKQTSVNLNKKKITLVLGENIDKGGSSGSGKTTIVSAIAYALYDKIPSGVSKDKLVNRNNDKKNTLLEVILLFKKGKDSYKIRRTRGEKTSMQLWKNDVDITPDSSTNFNAEIEKIVGISYNLFTQIVLFRGNSRKFLELSVSDQRSLIEELFGLTTLSSKARSLKKVIQETSKLIDIEKMLINQQKSQVATHNKHIDDIAKRAETWELDKEKKLANLKSFINDNSSIDFDKQEILINQYDDIVKSLSEPSSLLASNKKSLSLLISDLTKKESELSHLKDEKCPYCLQSFIDSNSKIAELESIILDNKNLISNLDVEILELETFVNDQNKIKQSLLNDIKFKTISDLIRSKNNIDLYKDQIVIVKKSENPHIETLESLISTTITVDETNLNDLVKLSEHQSFLLKLLTDKNSFIRKKALSKIIPFLNKRIPEYTEQLNLPHSVVFQPDMSCEISEYGRELDHGNLSDGEQKRLNFALCLSFRDVSEYLNNKVNVLFTDELEGGSLCHENIKHLTELIKSKSWKDKISVFSISHSQTFQDAFDNHMIVRKESGFSEIIEE